MKKILLVATAVLAFAMVVTGCGTTAEAAKAEPVVEEKKAPVKVELANSKGSGVSEPVNWQGKNVGRDFPKWVQVDESEIATLPIAAGKIVFPVESDGKDLDLTRIDAESKGAAEFARRIKVAVQTKGGSNASGNKDDEETAQKMVSEVTGFIAQTSFRGLEQIGSFWVLDRYDNGNLIYTYHILFGMNEQTYTEQISAIFKKVNARTPEEEKKLSEIEESISSASALLNVE